MENTKENLWSKSYIFILLANLFIYLSFYLLVPTLPTYAKQTGGSAIEASLVVSIFSITALSFRFLVGKASRKFGHVRVILMAAAVLALTTFSYIFIPIIGIILVRIIQGAGWGMASTTVASLVSEIVPEKRRGEGMGYYSLSMIIAMSLAPVVGIMVMNAYSFRFIAYTSIVFMIIAAFLLKGVKVDKGKRENAKYEDKGFSMQDLFEKTALLPSFLCFFLAMTLCAIMSYIMLYGKEIKMNNIWIYFIGHVTMILVTRPFIGKIFDRVGQKVVIIPGAAAMIIGLLILANVHSVPTLIAASLFYGFGYGAVQPSLQAWAVNRAPAHRKAEANSTFLSSMDLGFTFGPILLSMVAAGKGYGFMYGISSIFMIIFIAVYLLKTAGASENEQDEIEEAS
ncbi:MFS transporter [Clostridium sp. 19966]|uniref:MFS transporter n=1 Tax=Clostridium sp. 19966 TaxID=2768166 RepID=UPI0028E00AEF|nr:MFS transporter [Clostridium sp. 19966]MDT8717599.1 MFS transporter [Clostridium sp. 19966]